MMALNIYYFICFIMRYILFYIMQFSLIPTLHYYAHVLEFLASRLLAEIYAEYLWNLFKGMHLVSLISYYLYFALTLLHSHMESKASFMTNLIHARHNNSTTKF